MPPTIMIRRRRFLQCQTPLALLLLVLAEALPLTESDGQECSKNAAPLSQQQQHQCTLFLAPSTIPNSGLGIFTARSLDVGDRIGTGDLMIPIIDADLYHQNLGLYWMIDDYTWDGFATGMGLESERDDGVSAFGPGLDAAINCNLALINVGRIQAQWDEAGLHRSRDPGAGAISLYNNASTYAKTPIPAGAELFKSYGDDWFETRPKEFGMIPLSKDYPKANSLIRRFHSKFGPRSQRRLSDSVVQSLHHLITDLPMNSRVLNAIPKDFFDLTKAATDGIESLLQPHAIRTVEELEAKGRCLDNMRQGPSTLPQAGRGAFSTRFLPAGSIITGSPLFHIPTYEMMFMYDTVWNDKGDDYDLNFTNVVGHQLMMNYCFGHPESTALLCPYGSSVNYINHNATVANVKLQWAPDGHIGHNETWRKHTNVSDWHTIYTTKLAIDYVAVRDILPGEELFLDYGKEWEDAWTRHVQRWEKDHEQMDPMDKNYQSASYYNRLYANDDIRTVQEQETHPYPFNLETRCHSQTLWYFGGSNDNDKSPQKWIETKVEWPAAEVGDACQVLERWHTPDGEVVYTVEIADDEAEEGSPPLVARGVTRDLIVFGDVPYTTDLHLPWAFRHAMVFPDDMFPDNWRNMKKKT